MVCIANIYKNSEPHVYYGKSSMSSGSSGFRISFLVFDVDIVLLMTIIAGLNSIDGGLCATGC